MRKYKGNIKVDIRDFKKLEKDLKKMRDKEIDKFIKESARALAGEFLARVKQRAPVGDYNGKVEFTTSPKSNTKEVHFNTKNGKEVFFTANNPSKKVSFKSDSQPKVGGTLRKGWQLGEVKKTTQGYEVEISNEVKYAEYVENGHVIRNRKGGESKGWVEGRFMLRNTETEMAFIAPEVLEKKMERFLRGILNGK